MDEQQQDIERPSPAIESPPRRRDIGWPLRPGPRDIGSPLRPDRSAPEGRPPSDADEHLQRAEARALRPGHDPQSGAEMGDVHEDVELQFLTPSGIAQSN